MESTGNPITLLRKQRGLTVPELALLAQVEASTIWRAEVGDVTPRPRTLRKIAKALRCAPGDLVALMAYRAEESPR